MDKSMDLPVLGAERVTAQSQNGSSRGQIEVRLHTISSRPVVVSSLYQC